MHDFDLTQVNIECCDEIIAEYEYLDFEFTTNFDVETYFGIDLSADPGSFVNFYVRWFQDTNQLVADYEIIRPDFDEGPYDWELNIEEELYLRKIMLNYVKRVTGCDSFEECYIKLTGG